MRLIIVFFCFCSYYGLFAQDEVISPLEAIRIESINLNDKRSHSIDSMFVYTSDTLLLPVVDDFSKNHFQHYTKNISGNNTKVDMAYKLLNLSDDKPFQKFKNYTTTLTYRKIYDLNKKKDSIVLNKPIVIRVGELSNFPINYTNTIAYPAYTIYDTIAVGISSDTLRFESLDFFQDSSVIVKIQLKDKNAYWIDSNVYRNYTYPINPWTLGVATFDGLDASGYPYYINTSIRGYGDYLTSKPINLSGLKIKDSIYFSFLFQPKGYGDAPENITVGSSSQHDSLCLQFYNPTYNIWMPIWASSVDSDPVLFEKQSKEFKRVHLLLKDTTFFKSNFQFRFVNYGDLSGSLDHFHLDYVKFRKNSGYQDTLFKDFAFVYPIGSLIKGFTSIPWDHYLASQKKPINDSIVITLRNGSNSSENNQDGVMKIYNTSNSEINSIVLNGNDLTGNIVNYAPFTTYITYHDFSSSINLTETNSDADRAKFKIKASVSAPFLNIAENDTTYSEQVFEDYYAYDDGSAEAAYGLKSAQARVAYKFQPIVSDSLVGAYIHFVPTVKDKTKKQFSLIVWSEKDGKPDKVIYEDDDFSLREPVYSKYRNGFTPYYLKDFLRLPISDVFFIGLRQVDSENLNIGYDRNNNSQLKTYFTSDNINWLQSYYQGSLMIRPIFSSKMNRTLSLVNMNQPTDILIYPNPVIDYLTVELVQYSNYKGADLTDVNGKLINSFSKELYQINFEGLPQGVYFLTEINTGKVHKLIKQ